MSHRLGLTVLRNSLKPHYLTQLSHVKSNGLSRPISTSRFKDRQGQYLEEWPDKGKADLNGKLNDKLNNKLNDKLNDKLNEKLNDELKAKLNGPTVPKEKDGPTVPEETKEKDEPTVPKEKDEPTLFINLLPLWKGQQKMGVRYAPPIINSMTREIASKKYSIVTNYFSDQYLNDTDNESFLDHMRSVAQKLSKDMSSYKRGDMVLNIGGDHSIAMISIQKMHETYPNLRVIWVDAHADINSTDTSVSGNFHGMPVHYISDRSGSSGKISLDKISYIGVRDMDVAEISIVKDKNMRNYPKEEIIRRGSSTVLDELIENQDLMNNPVHISFDIDAVSPDECPSTGTPVEGGLSIDDVVKLFQKIKKTGNLVSIDLVEFNPLIGTEKDVEKTVQAIMKVFQSIL